MNSSATADRELIDLGSRILCDFEGIDVHGSDIAGVVESWALGELGWESVLIGSISTWSSDVADKRKITWSGGCRRWRAS